MGWTTTYKPKGEGIIEFLGRRSLNWSNEHGSGELIKGKVIKGVAYMAVRRTFPASENKEPHVFAAIYKVQMYPKAKDGYTFGYKDMDESMLPYYFDCPDDILDLLSPTEVPNEVEWRSECRKRNSASASIKLTKDAVVLFDHEIKFSNGDSARQFIVVDAKRGIVQAKTSDGFTGKYHIKSLRDYLVSGAAKILDMTIPCEPEPAKTVQQSLFLDSTAQAAFF